MTETEGKFRAEDLREVEDKLRKLDARLLEEVQETDIYYNYADPACGDMVSSDEALRLRVRSGGGAELTYKGPRARGPYKRRVELTVGISDPRTMMEILRRIGFAEAAVVRKKRRTYRLGRAIVALDEVEGLGSFVEVECGPSNGDAYRCVDEAAEALGLKGLEVNKTYLEMLYDERGGHG